MYANSSYAGGQPSDTVTATRVLVARRGHLRGRGEAHGGGTVALATFLIVITCLFEPAVEAYKAAFRVRAQEKNAADV